MGNNFPHEKTRAKIVLVTGASGFIGRNLLEELCQNCYIYALARRTQQEAGVKTHRNIEWILVDIAHQSGLAKVIERIKGDGGVDFIVHLSAYYDFDNKFDPEFERTNVLGTRLLFEHAKGLGIKRFFMLPTKEGCSRLWRRNMRKKFLRK